MTKKDVVQVQVKKKDVAQVNSGFIYAFSIDLAIDAITKSSIKGPLLPDK
jgi:hypothetical protein